MLAVYLKFRPWIYGFTLVVLGLASVTRLARGELVVGALFAGLVLLFVALDLWLWRPARRPQLAVLLPTLNLSHGQLSLATLEVALPDIVRIETGFIDQKKAYLLLHRYEQEPQRLYFPTSELEGVRQWLAAHLDSRLLAQADFHLL
jgi:hypothetical protein